MSNNHSSINLNTTTSNGCTLRIDSGNRKNVKDGIVVSDIINLSNCLHPRVSPSDKPQNDTTHHPINHHSSQTDHKLYQRDTKPSANQSRSNRHGQRKYVNKTKRISLINRVIHHNIVCQNGEKQIAVFEKVLGEDILSILYENFDIEIRRCCICDSLTTLGYPTMETVWLVINVKNGSPKKLKETRWKILCGQCEEDDCDDHDDDNSDIDTCKILRTNLVNLWVDYEKKMRALQSVKSSRSTNHGSNFDFNGDEQDESKEDDGHSDDSDDNEHGLYTHSERTTKIGQECMKMKNEMEDNWSYILNNNKK